MMAFDFCQPGRALIAHAGDSRVYRMRNGSLHQLTVDHSVAAAAGLNNEEDIPAIFRGMITRAVGIKETVEAEFQITDVQIGDVYLICSDGLNGMINDCEIAERLNGITSEQLPSAANLLIADANAKGGRDNISVILIHVGKSKASSSNLEHLTRLELASHEGDTRDPLERPASSAPLTTSPAGENHATLEANFKGDLSRPHTIPTDSRNVFTLTNPTPSITREGNPRTISSIEAKPSPSRGVTNQLTATRLIGDH